MMRQSPENLPPNRRKGHRNGWRYGCQRRAAARRRQLRASSWDRFLGRYRDHFPRTLRDVRRMVGRGNWNGLPVQVRTATLISGALIRVELSSWHRWEIVVCRALVTDDRSPVAALDALIGRHGPDLPPQEGVLDNGWLQWLNPAARPPRHVRERLEELERFLSSVTRPKGTDEVDPEALPGDANRIHGGDGASGEVDDAPPARREGGSDDGLEGARGAGLPADEGDNPSMRTSGSGRGRQQSASEGNPVRLGAEGASEDARHRANKGPAPRRGGRAGAGDPGDALGHQPDPASLDNPAGTRAGLGVMRGGQGGRNQAEKPALAAGAPGSGGAPNMGTAASAYGGDHRRRIRASHARDQGTRRAAARMVRELDRLLDVRLGVVGKPTPRVDAERLVRELAARSVRASRWRRQEAEPGVGLLLVDVSGSCSAYCSEAWAALRDHVVAQRPDTWLVAHSNGWPIEVRRPGGRIEAVGPGHLGKPDRSMPWWRALVRQIAPGRRLSTIAWGDYDPGPVFRLLAEHGPVVLLTSYCCSAVGKVFAWECHYGVSRCWAGIGGDPQQLMERSATALRLDAKWRL